MGIKQRCVLGAVIALIASVALVRSSDMATAEDGSTKISESGAALAVVAEPGSSLADVANEPAAKEPLPTEAALEEGKSMFRGLCSGCHGGTARGGKGPDLTDERWLHGSTDTDIAHVIQNGVSGTTMKKLGEALKEEQIAKIIAYVRSLARKPGESDWKPYMGGDAAAGERIFFDLQSQTACNKCHALGGRGGGIGPPLDRIVSRRSPDYIM
jgi:cbb3-type cytochrome c oxidase subunit III